MNIKELNDIVSCMNLEQIQIALEQHGYRHASKNENWEFDPIAIVSAKDIQKGESYEDVFDDNIYVADIHSKVKGYRNIEFIVVTVNKVYRNKNDLKFPLKMLLYTDAPINEEYEKRMLKIEKCSMCKKDFTMRELCEINGKLICDDCFEKDLLRLKVKGKSKLAKKVKGGKERENE